MKRTMFWMMAVLSVLIFLRNLHAGANWYGDMYVIPAVFRTSVTATSDQLVTITTRAVDFGGVFVSSAGSADARIGIYDMAGNLIISTVNASAGSAFPFGYGVNGSSVGLRYFNTGTTPANITIMWQYKYGPDTGKR